MAYGQTRGASPAGQKNTGNGRVCVHTNFSTFSLTHPRISITCSELDCGNNEVAVEGARWLAELCEVTPIKASLPKRWHTNSIKFVNYLLFLTFQSLKSKFVKPFEKLSDTKRVLGIRTQDHTQYNCAVWGENLRITKAFQLLAWRQSQVQ